MNVRLSGVVSFTVLYEIELMSFVDYKSADEFASFPEVGICTLLHGTIVTIFIATVATPALTCTCCGVRMTLLLAFYTHDNSVVVRRRRKQQHLITC